jgi:hypothetical protein
MTVHAARAHRGRTWLKVRICIPCWPARRARLSQRRPLRPAFAYEWCSHCFEASRKRRASNHAPLGRRPRLRLLTQGRDQFPDGRSARRHFHWRRTVSSGGSRSSGAGTEYKPNVIRYAWRDSAIASQSTQRASPPFSGAPSVAARWPVAHPVGLSKCGGQSLNHNVAHLAGDGFACTCTLEQIHGAKVAGLRRARFARGV